MSLASRLAALPIDPARQYCTVGRLLAQIEPEPGGSSADYHAFLGALSTPSWPAATLTRMVVQEGLTLDRRHVSEHRRGHTIEQCVRPTVGVIHGASAE